MNAVLLKGRLIMSAVFFKGKIMSVVFFKAKIMSVVFF